MELIHGISYESLKEKNQNLSPFQTYLFEKLKQDNTSLEEYLSKDLTYAHSPFLLPDITKSIQIIKKHLKLKNHILLYGDRDTDGVSSTSLLGIYLRDEVKKFGGKLTIKTSSQNDDYGLCDTVLKNIISISPNLLITLDFGTSNYKEINLIAEKGIDVIVLDHHEIPTIIPNCQLINPKREDSKYPEKRICTAALSFKLIQAMECVIELEQKEMTQKGLLFSDSIEIDPSKIDPNEIYKDSNSHSTKIHSMMDLVAIGTVADMMPLQGENRIFVKNGMDTLLNVYKEKPKNRLGLFLLMKKLAFSPNKILSKDLGWGLGPVLNAAGRMGKTEIALKILLSENNEEAESLSEELLSLNKERRERTKRNMFRVEKYFERKPERTDKEIIYCYEPDMEPGVSGIVASKLVEKYNKTAIFITPDHGKARGSVRSNGNGNVVELLARFSNILEHFGGHPEAGGFSIDPIRLKDFEFQLEKEAPDWLTIQKANIKSIESIVSFQTSSVTEKLFNEILFLEPLGQGNPQPIFSIKKCKILSPKPMGDGTHLRFVVQGISPKIKFVLWNKANDFLNHLSQNLETDLWGYFEENYFNGSNNLQFVVSYFA
jgi:single-stranded-DNA-specific exonuclease